MFRYSRPHPYVHVLRMRGVRTVRRMVWGGALILLGVGYLLRNEGLIDNVDVWLIAPALVALSGLVRLFVASALQRLPLADRLPIADKLVAHAEEIGRASCRERVC